MRRFFGKLADAIRQTNTAPPGRRGPRRAPLQVEALETRELLSVSPVAALSAVKLNVPPLTPIQFKYQSLGGASGFLGPAVTSELPTPYGNGRYEQYQHGNIYWSVATGAHDVYGPILNEYNLTASEQDAYGNSVQKGLGLPTTDVFGLVFGPGAGAVLFQGGGIYTSLATGTHAIYGGIYTEYQATQHEKDAHGNEVYMGLGLPTSDETNMPGLPGVRVNTFAGGAAIYWSQATAAHVVYGAIATKYNSYDGPYSVGLPTSDEANVPGMPGVRVTQFQNNGAIYWSAATGAHLVYGSIEAEYLATQGETDPYGTPVKDLLQAPTSDVMNVPGVPGAAMVTFQGGNIYWSQATGAHVVYGGILNGHVFLGIVGKYLSLGGPTSFLGLPISDEINFTGQAAGISISYFQHGWISWNPEKGTYVVNHS